MQLTPKSVPVTSGLPQGSVLGSILLLIYINELPEELTSKVRLFADDTAVYLTAGGTDDSNVLQQDLDKLMVWESRWDMEFNPSKGKVVRVTTSRKSVHFHTNYMAMSWRLLPAQDACGLTYPVAYPGIPT